MAIARREIVDTNVTRWYHCISRCVQQASLLESRKLWLVERMRHLSEIFAIAVGGFAILDNHLHLVLRIDEDVAKGWKPEEVVERWAKLYPVRDKKGEPLPVSELWKSERLAEPGWIEMARSRLCNLGWYMKSLKEPLAKLANRESGCRGHFFDARYKSIAVLDVASLLATTTYVDLNPLAAGIAKTPESSEHASIKSRVDHARAHGRINDLVVAEAGSVVGLERSAGLEDGLWLCPIEDRRNKDSKREGMIEGFTLGSYLLLLDHTSRLYREGKATIAAGLADIFSRLRTDASHWDKLLTRLRTKIPRRRSLGSLVEPGFA